MMMRGVMARVTRVTGEVKVLNSLYTRFWSRFAPAITQSTPCPRKATPATSVSAFRITIISYIGSIDGPLAILHSRPPARAVRAKAAGHCRVHGSDASRARIPEAHEPHCLSASLAGTLRRGGTLL